MAKRKQSVVDVMRDRIKNAGKSKKQMFFLRDGNKRRLRFLNDMEDSLRIVFHDKWGEINTPCLQHYGKYCPYCDRDDVRTRDNFVWSIYNYDDKEVQVFMFKANESTPVPHMIAMYDAYGTICDRDYVVARSGERLDTSYSIVPMDKGKFRRKANPLTKKEILKLLRQAFPPGDDYEDDGEEADDVDDGDDGEDGDVPWDDGDDGDDEDYEEEEEEEVKPKKSRKRRK